MLDDETPDRSRWATELRFVDVPEASNVNPNVNLNPDECSEEQPSVVVTPSSP